MKKVKPFFVFLSLCIFTSCGAWAQDCTLKMVVKDVAQLPFIEAPPSNHGVYQELFQKAAGMIHCRLEITRLSTKKAHDSLKNGTVDFYPNVVFSKERAGYLHFAENGLMTAQYGITSDKIPEIKNYQEIQALNLIWLMKPGAPEEAIAKKIKEVNILREPTLNIDTIKSMVAWEGDLSYFALFDKEVVEYYIAKRHLSSLSEIGLKLHKHCCNGDLLIYLGFSKHSPHYQEELNPHYHAHKALSPNNFPTRVSQDSVAYQLEQALIQLKQSGETEKIYRSFFPQGYQPLSSK